MADKKISQLDALTTLALTDLIPVVTNLATTPETRKITVADLIAALLGSGWIPDAQPWTYASPSTFTRPGDATKLLAKGAKLWCQNAGEKFFYSVGAVYNGGTNQTTITVAGGSDYSLVNAPITAAYYSYANIVQGFPGWFNWAAPTYSGFSTPPSGGVSVFRAQGTMCTFVHQPAVDGTSNTTGFTVTPPITPALATVAGNWSTAKDNGALLASVGPITTNPPGNYLRLDRAPNVTSGWTSGGAKNASFIVDYLF